MPPLSSDDYHSLITSEHRSRPKFAATVAVTTQAAAEATNFALDLPAKFDLDLAEGVQLDVIGAWVGCNRVVEVPLDIWFSFDIPGKGFDEGVWRGPFDPGTGLAKLDDVHFRRLIRAVILANHWDGSLSTYHAIFEAGIPGGNTVHVKDNLNMTIEIHVGGPVLSPLQEALLTSGRLSEIRPAGVAISAFSLP